MPLGTVARLTQTLTCLTEVTIVQLKMTRMMMMMMMIHYSIIVLRVCIIFYLFLLHF